MARALCILLLAVSALFVGAIILSLAEQGTPCGATNFLNQFFELVSALGTVGLSTGISVQAGTITRLVLCALMYLGRAGLLTIALAFGHEDEESAIRYPKGEMMIG
ncbi:MAG: TrkH family potassium uptake protein [Clostridia bacterium]|nr:TrkH family potassium uptake protein [Clostridia bacterium]